MRTRRILVSCAVIVALAPTWVRATDRTPDRRVIYKEVDGAALGLEIFVPRDAYTRERRPAFIAIHGGGWGAGAPRMMFPWAAWAAEHGFVGITVQYRLYRAGGGTTVFHCVQDVRSALRYIRAHAEDLGVDPARLVVCGASAGGHLAVATALFPFDDPRDDLAVSPAPQALVLFSPVIDTSAAGYGQAKIGPRWEELSPRHRVAAGLPPTLIFHGTADRTTPYIGAQQFHAAMLAAGNHCRLVTVEGAGHTFMFKVPELREKTKNELAAFLAELGFLARGAPAR